MQLKPLVPEGQVEGSVFEHYGVRVTVGTPQYGHWCRYVWRDRRRRWPRRLRVAGLSRDVRSRRDFSRSIAIALSWRRPSVARMLRQPVCGFVTSEIANQPCNPLRPLITPRRKRYDTDERFLFVCGSVRDRHARSRNGSDRDFANVLRLLTRHEWAGEFPLDCLAQLRFVQN